MFMVVMLLLCNTGLRCIEIWLHNEVLYYAMNIMVALSMVIEFEMATNKYW